MKIKAGVFIILLIILICGAVYANSEVSAIDNGLSHNLETIYGDEDVLDGLQVGLKYLTPKNLTFSSELSFRKGGTFEESTITSTTKTEDAGIDETSIYYMPGLYMSGDEKLSKWVYDHTGIYAKGVRHENKGFFYLIPDAEDVIFEGYLYDEDGMTSTEKANPEKIELPEGNGIYAVDYTESPTASYVVSPNADTIVLIGRLDEDCTVRMMGITRDGRFLEIFYTEDGLLKMRTLDTSSGDLSNETVLFKEDDVSRDLTIYFPEELKSDDEEDYTIVSCGKGFYVVDNSCEKPEIAIKAIYGEADGPDVMGKWLERNESRCRRVWYDGDRLVSLQRVMKKDPVFKDHKGTSVLVYGKDGLEYVGIIGSGIYEKNNDQLYDAYANEYMDENYSDCWIHPDEKAEKSETDEEDEDGPYFYTGSFWGFYSIDKVKY